MTIARLIEGRDGGEIVQCDVGSTVADAASLLAARRIGALPVLDEGQVVGIFSERDLLYCIAKEGAEILERKIARVMTAPAITIEPSMSVMDALSLMTKRRIRHLPVVKGGEMIGFVSIGDLVKFRMDRIESEAAAMKTYIQTA